MPKVSINILTKNRCQSLGFALTSVLQQTFKDYEVIVINDASVDGTLERLKHFSKSFSNIKIINHNSSSGITQSRKEALEASMGEYIAILDDDDEWIDENKLKKQVEFLDLNTNYVLVGGGIEISQRLKVKSQKFRPETDHQIRNWMLLKNPFFTSTVMFRKQAAILVGGFAKDNIDFAEDYDLWLRLGILKKMYNFQEIFTHYHQPMYSKEKQKQFLLKQLRLISLNKKHYPYFWLANLILKIRIFFLG